MLPLSPELLLRKMSYLCRHIYNDKMITLRRVSLTLILSLICLGAARSQTFTTNKVYVFGVGDSMRDSTVNLTTIQQIDSAHLQKHTGFLLDRPDFANQLSLYFFKTEGDKTRLPIIYFFKDERKAVKNQMRVRKRYLDEGMLVKQIEPSEFQFAPVLSVTIGESLPDKHSAVQDDDDE